MRKPRHTDISPFPRSYSYSAWWDLPIGCLQKSHLDHYPKAIRYKMQVTQSSSEKNILTYKVPKTMFLSALFWNKCYLIHHWFNNSFHLPKFRWQALSNYNHQSTKDFFFHPGPALSQHGSQTAPLLSPSVLDFQGHILLGYQWGCISSGNPQTCSVIPYTRGT